MDIYNIIVLAIFIGVIALVTQVDKKVKDRNTSKDRLTTTEKIFTVIAGLLLPLIAVNGIMYYGLKKKYPAKAKTANSIGWITLLVLIGLSVLVNVVLV